jgi:hypothetical protein
LSEAPIVSAAAIVTSLRMDCVFIFLISSSWAV